VPRSGLKDQLVKAASDWVAADPLGPPPGWTGSDRDGAMCFFGCDPSWTPDKEGQRPAELPPPAAASRQHPDRCTVCGAAFGTDTRRSPDQTCMGCMRASTGKDARLVAEIVRDAAQCEARLAREAAEKEAAGTYAQRKHGKAGADDE
jgi:hypothetical protein